MPFAYEINPLRRLVFVRAWGALTLIDLVAAKDALQADELFDPEFAMVQELPLGPDLADMGIEVIEELAAAAPFAPSTKRAFVAVEPGYYSIAKAFQIQREVSGAVTDMLVCRSLSDALAWVGARDFIPTKLIRVRPAG